MMLSISVSRISEIVCADADSETSIARATTRDANVLQKSRNGTNDHPQLPRLSSRRYGHRQSTALLVAVGVLLASGCRGTPELPDDADLSAAAGAYGIAVADEPQAALIGRDVLAGGGSAADAATAMYFTMAVTLPSAASLGGGGVCVVFDPGERKVHVLDFLPGTPKVVPPTADRPTAVPGNVRGFFALQARFGRDRWAEALAPAETRARFGTPVSRALVNEMTPVEAGLAADPGMRRVFAPTGTFVGEGDPLVQLDLATVLARIRAEGPGDFYTGQLAEKLVTGTTAAGGSLARDDLQAYVPTWRSPLVVTDDGLAAHLPAPPPMAGAVAGQMWAMLVSGDRFADAAPGDRDAVLADAARRAFAESDRLGLDRPGAALPGDPQAIVAHGRIDSLLASPAPRALRPGAAPRPENPSAAGLIAVDASGQAVACSVTLNNLFGTGRMAEGTGIVLAAMADAGGRGSAMLAPMLVTDDANRRFHFAATANGGVVAPEALVGTAARTVLAEEPLARAIAAPRLLALPDLDRMIVEERMPAAAIEGLRRQGAVVTTGTLGRVGAAVCPDGLPGDPARCQAAADPRGSGLAVTTN
jgi:gamma-glutamyltranspeptidase/glutathione hydrolase